MKQTDSMGINPLLSSHTNIFPRTFRFLFISKNNPNFQNLVKRVEIDPFVNTLMVYVMEVTDDKMTHPHDWLEKISEKDYEDNFSLIAFDGCGNSLYTLEFDKAKAFDLQTEYDYSTSEVVTHKIGIEFDKMTRTNPKSLDQVSS